MKNILSIILLFLSSYIGAQDFISIKNASPKLLKSYKSASNLYKTDQYDKAIKAFQKIITKESKFIDAYIQLGSLYYESRDYRNAEKYFNQAINLSRDYNPKVFYTLALANREEKNFALAKNNLKQFIAMDRNNTELLAKAKLMLPNYEFADSAIQHPLDYKIRPLTAWNSLYSEYLPSMTADAKTAVFTRRGLNNNEDIYISYWNDTIWSEPQSIDEINTVYNEGAATISPDGNSIVFTSCDRKESTGGCDLYISDYDGANWSIALPLSKEINTAAYESQACFAENGRVLYFVSDRKGSLGGYDIWYSTKQKDNAWSRPKNLGDMINTSRNEDCPFMHQNGTTLFFSSDGFAGMGGKDIFYSNRNKNGQWTKPVNLGYPLNSPLDESSFITAYDGVTGYYASDKFYDLAENKSLASQKNLDLYTLTIPESIRPIPSTYVAIESRDIESKKAIQSKISIFDIDHNMLYYEGMTDVNGRLLISLRAGSNYGLHIEKDGYIFDNSNFLTDVASFHADQQHVIRFLQAINQTKTNATIILKNIFFEFGSAILKAESNFELIALFKTLTDNTSMKIKILGHTDNVGSESDNIKLSSDRAKAVYDFLIKKGIEATRLSYEGRGELTPIATNETESGRQQNRRTEFIILGK